MTDGLKVQIGQEPGDKLQMGFMSIIKKQDSFVLTQSIQNLKGYMTTYINGIIFIKMYRNKSIIKEAETVVVFV